MKMALEWLLSSKARIFAVPQLHAKIYLNEKRVLLSSMNFTEYSTMNSMEIAQLIHDETDERRIRDYVDISLSRAARSLNRSGILQTIQKVVSAAATVV